MEKKKLIKSVLWLIAIAILGGIWKFTMYSIDMYYSNLAPKQFDDDSAYGKLQFNPMVNTLTNIIFGVVALILFYQIIKVWFFNKGKEKE